MDKLLLLHDLQKSARHLFTIKDLEFFIPNETYKLIPYEQCIFWLYNEGSISIRTVSGGGQVDPKGPFSIWISSLLKDHIKHSIKKQHPDHKPVVLTPLQAQDIHTSLQSNWEEYVHEYGLVILFFSPINELMGGLWLDRKNEFQDAEQKILEELCDQYSVTLHHINDQRKRHNLFLSLWERLNKIKKYILLFFLLLCFLPVKLSITAPAEIVAKDAKTITAPYDGVIDEILIDPGASVKEGQLIAKMDQTKLRSEADISLQALNIAKANISQTKRMAVSNPDKHAELGLIMEEIKVKQLEYDYAKALLERSEITAPQDGVAIYDDKSSIEDTPVTTGQTILQIADPQHYELLIRIPVDALIPYNQNTPVSFYLNARPLTSIQANINTAGFQATPDPDGLLSYKLRADIQNKTSHNLKIGWKGTAKIYGDWTILSYAILRRPLASLRQMMGV